MNKLSDLSKVKGLPFDFRGHFKSDLMILSFIDSFVGFLNFDKMPKGKVFEVVKAGTLLRCIQCGEELGIYSDGYKMWFSSSCPYPNGHPKIEFELNIPSGMMVVGNDFRDGFRIMGDYDISTLPGTANTSRKYASVGLAHGYVGNTCPSLFKIKDDKFVIGNEGSDGRHPVKHARRVAGITTDLWWYSIADYNQFKMAYDKDPLVDNLQVQVVKCKPGLYKFSDQHHLVGDTTSPVVYTNIQRIGKARPVINFKEQFDTLDITAEQVFNFHFRTASDFYGNPRDLSYLDNDSYASHVSKSMRNICLGITPYSYPFYYLADGYIASYKGEYHPNGWHCSHPDITPEEPEIEIPIFDKPYRWLNIENDLSNLYAGVQYKKISSYKPLNKSFARLAFNVMQCIMRYGYYKYPQNKLVQDDSVVRFIDKLFELYIRKYEVPDFCLDLL